MSKKNVDFGIKLGILGIKLKKYADFSCKLVCTHVRSTSSRFNIVQLFNHSFLYFGKSWTELNELVQWASSFWWTWTTELLHFNERKVLLLLLDGGLHVQMYDSSKPIFSIRVVFQSNGHFFHIRNHHKPKKGYFVVVSEQMSVDIDNNDI